MTRDHMLAERCLECGRYMRPLKTDRELYPGRVAYGGRGYCSNCYKKLRDKERVAEGLPPIMKRKSTASIRGRDGRRAPGAVYDRDLSLDEQRTLYLVLRRLRGEEQALVASILGLVDNTVEVEITTHP